MRVRWQSAATALWISELQGRFECNPERLNLWSAPAERSGDGALDATPSLNEIQSGVALRLPLHSKRIFPWR
jgi:hypothetical protein